MDIEVYKTHSKTLILNDIDEYSKKLNIHKNFVIDNKIDRKYYCLTWYGINGPLLKYFNSFINNILELFDENNIESITANLEKSNNYHIHVAIIFKRTMKIFNKLNSKYEDINIEAINMNMVEQIKTYCSKKYSQVTSNTIHWRNETIPKTIDININDVKIKMLHKKEYENLKTQINIYYDYCKKHGIQYNITEDINRIKNGEIPLYESQEINRTYVPEYEEHLKKFKFIHDNNEVTINNLKEEIDDKNGIIMGNNSMIEALRNKLYQKQSNEEIEIKELKIKCEEYEKEIQQFKENKIYMELLSKYIDVNEKLNSEKDKYYKDIELLKINYISELELINSKYNNDKKVYENDINLLKLENQALNLKYNINSN